MFTQSFLRDCGERALATFAQSFIALVGTDGMGMLDVNLGDAALASIAAGALSILKSLAAAKGPIGDESASLLNISE